MRQVPLLLWVPLLIVISGCASQSKQGVACATPLSFEHATQLAASGCEGDLASLVEQLDDGESETRMQLAQASQAQGEYELAAYWYAQANSLEGFAALLALYGAQGPLADDAAYLRTEIRRAKLQQAFGQQPDMPNVSKAQPLYVQGERSVLLEQADLDSTVLEALSQDERVYLLDVVYFQEVDEYWVEAYFAPTLQLGWVPAGDLGQQTAVVRAQFEALEAYPTRRFAQQLLVAAIADSMPLAQLRPLDERQFFDGAAVQRDNTQQLLRHIGQTAAQCSTEVDQLEQQFERFLMAEGPAPERNNAELTSQIADALMALTKRPQTLSQDDAAYRTQLSEQAYGYFRIRLRNQVEQRLCNSLPNLIGEPELIDATCEALQRVQYCVNRAEAIFNADES